MHLRASGAPAGLPLRLAVDRGRVAVFAGERLLGLVQPKHGWLAPLVAHGASAVLLRVTGDPARGHTLGVNIAFTGLGDAVRAFERAAAEQRASAPRRAPRSCRACRGPRGSAGSEAGRVARRRGPPASGHPTWRNSRRGPGTIGVTGPHSAAPLTPTR